jgi:hypothetical protein
VVAQPHARLRPKEWGAHKKSGGYLFEQLPKATITFEDGSTFDLFQSLTILRYLARKAGTPLSTPFAIPPPFSLSLSRGGAKTEGAARLL